MGVDSVHIGCNVEKELIIFGYVDWWPPYLRRHLLVENDTK